MFEAGRGLDRRIAELMGDWLDDDRVWVSRDSSTYATVDGGPRPYSTDIESAWRIVEHMRLLGYGVTLASPGKQWSASFSGALVSDGAVAPTAPYAICLAALKVTGVEL